MKGAVFDYEDNAGCADEFREGEDACDDYVDELYTELSPSKLGSGFYFRQLSELHEGTTVTAGSKFYCRPRPYDRLPSEIPQDHPLRSISYMLQNARTHSVVRVCAYMLTDPFAIDLLIHHAKSKTVKRILHPDQKSYDRIYDFLFRWHDEEEYGGARDVMRNAMQVRVAQTTHSRFTQMHMNTILTKSLLGSGSYNLSCPARCANWETFFFLNAENDDITRFDTMWDSLEGRELATICPFIFESKKRKREESAVVGPTSKTSSA